MTSQIRISRAAPLLFATLVLLLTLVPATPAQAFGSSKDFPGVPELNAGGYMTCGVRADNVAACWGDNVSEGPGQSTPPPDARFIEVNAGYAVACGVKTDTTAACWGNNADGQATPGPGTYLHVVGGFRSSCGIKTDRTLACWGFNDNGSTVPPLGQFARWASASATAAPWGSTAPRSSAGVTTPTARPPCRSA